MSSGEITEGEVSMGDVMGSPENDQRKEEILGVLEVNKNLSLAYREIRFQSTPGMAEANEAGNTESIAEHMWAVQLMWRHLQGTCPALASSVDSEKVTEMLGMHDIGEIVNGDVSRHVLMDGVAEDKHLGEREGLLQILAPLDTEAKERYLELFDEYEDPEWKTWTKESAVGHLIDSLQGDAHYFDYGDPNSHPDRTLDLMRRYTGRPVKRLLQLFQEEGNQPAFDDVMDIVAAHCAYVTERGLTLAPEDLVS